MINKHDTYKLKELRKSMPMNQYMEFLFNINTNKQKDDNCWIWIGDRDKRNGYGKIGIRNYNTGKLKHFRAHRLSYLLYKNEIPEGLCVCHKCDNKLCVNPNHLFLGTQTENILDRDNKGRQQKGEKHYLSKLKESDIREIRSLSFNGISEKDIASLFSVTYQNIHAIINRKTWKHINA